MKKTWYHSHNGKYVIDVRVGKIEQLFDKRDPNPYRSKDLDDDVVEYILSSAQEIGFNKLGKLRVTCNDSLDLSSLETAKIAVKDYFLYREEISQKKLRAIIALGFKTLVIGASFLTFAISISAFLPESFLNTFTGKLLKESLLLLGWVSLWKPVNIFLYEWWPLLSLKRMHRKIHNIDLEFVIKDKYEI